MPWVGFEPTISAGERPKTYALDRAATGTGISDCIRIQNQCSKETAEHFASLINDFYYSAAVGCLKDLQAQHISLHARCDFKYLRL